MRSGSVFSLHPEVKEDWLKWSPQISRGKAQTHAAGAGEADSEAHHGIAGCFHHDDKSEDETKDEDHPRDQEKHGFFHRLLH